MLPGRALWGPWGLRRRVTAVFTLSALVLGISAGAIIWGISRAYLVDVRQQTGIRQAQASAAAIGRLLSPEDPDLPRQAQEFAGVNESGVLITRGSRVLASAGLGPQQIPARLRQLIDSGESARQRVRVNGVVQLIVGFPWRRVLPIISRCRSAASTTRCARSPSRCLPPAPPVLCSTPCGLERPLDERCVPSTS